MRRFSVGTHLVLGLVCPMVLIAQSAKQVGFVCERSGHPRYVVACDGQAACDRVAALHNCSAHGEGCGNSQGPVKPTSTFTFSHLSTARTLVQPPAMGAIVGALGSSFSKLPNGNSAAGPAAVGGAAVFATVGVLKNASHLPFVGAVVAGAEAGALGGAAAGAIEDAKIIKGSANDLGAPSKVGTNAAKGAEIGAALGAVVHFVGPAETFRAFPVLRAFLKPDGRATILQSGERLGVSIKW